MGNWSVPDNYEWKIKNRPPAPPALTPRKSMVNIQPKKFEFVHDTDGFMYILLIDGKPTDIFSPDDPDFDNAYEGARIVLEALGIPFVTRHADPVEFEVLIDRACEGDPDEDDTQ